MSFEGQFWSQQDNNFEGFDRLSKRMKDGKHMYDEVAEYIQKRIKIEMDYGKALQNLGKVTKACTDTGTSKEAWENVKLQTIVEGKIHLDFAGEMREHILSPANSFREKQRFERKQTEDAMARSQKAKVAATDKVTKAERKYHNESRAVEDAKRDANDAANVQRKDKLTAKVSKCEAAAESAQQAYKDAVRLLNDTRVKWEREMEKCEKQYHAMETTRLEHQRNALWLMANIVSAMAVEEDKAAEEIRKGLERMVPADDLRHFVEQHRVGSERPDKIIFRAYGEPAAIRTNPTGAGSRVTSTLNRVSSGGLIGGMFQSATLPRGGSSQTLQTSTSVSPTTTVLPSREPSHENSTKLQQPNRRSGVTASVMTARPQYSHTSPSPTLTTSTTSPPKAAGGTTSDFYKAAFNYQPQGPEELPLVSGEKLRVLDKSEDAWWKVKKENGRVGMCPSSYLKPIAS